MNETAIYICAALVFGILIGKGNAAQASATAPNEQQAVKPQDWWTYAGSWA